MLKKFRTSLSGKKGFTLVELVVVLVILAILAALLMPSLTGYIDKAKDKRVVAEVHQVVIAAQTLADEAYALATDEPDADTYESVLTLDAIAELAEIKGELSSVMIDVDSGKVAYVELSLGGITGYYTEEDGIVTDLTKDDVTAPENNDDEYADIQKEDPDA